MIAYVDSSVVLRVVLRQRNALPQWKAIETGVASALLEVECLRTLDRLRLTEDLGDHVIALRREAVFRVIGALQIVEMTRAVLERASQPMPTALGTLDAIHLATALLYREHADAPDLVLATHDTQLCTAGRASGLSVIGV